MKQYKLNGNHKEQIKKLIQSFNKRKTHTTKKYIYKTKHSIIITQFKISNSGSKH